MTPLSGLRVVDLSSWIAGGYCTKLLTDAGADVVKVETPVGDPLRRWWASDPDASAGASGAGGAGAAGASLDGGLFNYLHASQRSIVVNPADPAHPGHALDDVHALLADAHMVVWSHGPSHTAGSALDDRPLLTPDEIVQRHPHLLVGAITPFGLHSPWADRPASEFTLQAWSGGMVRLNRGRPDRAPTFVAGQVGEWMSGLYAAIGMLAAWRCGGDGHHGRLVDVSMLEVQAATLTYYPVTFHDQLGRPMQRDRFVPMPGVSPAADGIVGLGTGTGQQWLDFCAMVEHPEWAEQHANFMNRGELAPKIAAWTSERTVAEICELATAFRLPNAPIVNGTDMATTEHMRVRDSFVRNPRDGAVNPRPPCRFENVPLRTPTPAPALGHHTGEPFASSTHAPPPRAPGRLPFEGLRVLDMTAFWAGPLTGHLLALLGAEVIHLESATRPDGVRFVGGVPPSEPNHLERSPIFAALNTNKKSLAIDTRSQAGVDLLKQFLTTCDVLVENYTPRVLDQLGLDAATLRAINPRLITVRMPGFGLDGPWRDVAAFAFVIEDASGFTWLTGHPDVPPAEPYCIGDPNAGLHALYGLQVALAHRDRTGEGGLLEAAMLDAALSVTAEQVIEHSARNALLQRAGNRGPLAAPQGLYQVADTDEFGRDDCWVAIAVHDDAQWDALRTALGTPAWASDPVLASSSGRRAHHDDIDAHLSAWCRRRSADEVVQTLLTAGVPAAPVVQPHRQDVLTPLQQRGYFETLVHPVIGEARYATMPITFTPRPGDSDGQWHRRPAPLLGEHTLELLRDLGLPEDQVAALAAEGVIGGTSLPN